MNNKVGNKIPYDAAPIVRDSGAGRQTPARKKLSHVIFIAAIFLFNIVISGLFIVYIYNNKNNESIVINNQIMSQQSEIVAASSKAKLSSVCIGAGGSDENKVSFGPLGDGKVNVPDYKELLIDTDSKGSGVIIDINKQTGEAYILTCNHVIGNFSSSVFVLLYDGYQPIHATVVGRSSNYDLAVLKIQDDQVRGASQAATIANSALVAEGDSAIAVGNPQHNGFAVTVGHVSRTNVLVSTAGLSIRSLQVDTAINAGNSGGGLFDDNGNLIGIVQTKNTNAGIDNVASAIHSNTALSIAKNLIEGRQLQYVDFGLELEIKGVEIKSLNGKFYRVDKIYIKDILETSDLYGKLSKGDNIVAVSYNDKTVQVMNEYFFEEIKFDLRVGDEIQFVIAGKTEPVNVVITKLSSAY